VDPITLATTALSVGSTAVKTVGGMAGAQQDKYAAESRARIAKIQSDQTEATAMDDLRRQVGNIKAIRASAGANVNSPTTQALIDEERKNSRLNLDKKKASFKLDELQAKADSNLYSNKAMLTLLGGGFQVGNSLASADYG
jgi:hypothetical protein